MVNFLQAAAITIDTQGFHFCDNDNDRYDWHLSHGAGGGGVTRGGGCTESRADIGSADLWRPELWDDGLDHVSPVVWTYC